ncbi:thiol:disulfide interchange protein DsbA/DsbL [Eikenella sp. S3360]|uniref:Thiol:disulfide interchange protein n=1 Tax=Eikenella glucosivorans TaxID=2766967 RepID=A0ABS0NC35_9NEIS|nr:thiol:disulfide interchange protein DsbA/DsbL [Eikenella glucosivorans]MBH5329817.1 thiol:disulfide interchange protein DsbA/DsbL [Eikenella glucosivorans]
MKLKALLLAALAVFAVGTAQAKAVEGTDYIVRTNVIKPVHPNKIEVTEFFGYFCVHCQHLEPAIEQQSKRFASDTVLRQEHIVWQPAHQTLAQLSAAVQSTGLSRQANRAIFSALMDGKVTDEASLKNWIQQQPYGSRLLAAYNSPQAAAAARNLQQQTVAYNITKTPTIVVGGKYELTDSKNMQVLQELIEKVRAERGMPAPAPRATVRSRAASLAGQANR